MKIFKGQFFRLILDTGIDLTDASAKVIKYTKPDGITTGQWTATIDSDDNTKMYFDITNQVDQSGRWMVYAKATFTAGNIPGEVS